MYSNKHHLIRFISKNLAHLGIPALLACWLDEVIYGEVDINIQELLLLRLLVHSDCATSCLAGHATVTSNT